MTTTEIVVAVLEAGHETKMSRADFREHVANMLLNGRFTKVDRGKWVRG
jgi:hypothetical protein